MKEHLPSLLKLSAIDIKIQELTDAQTEIPRNIQQILADVLGLTSEITAKEQELARLQKQKSECDEALQSKKEWLEQREPASKSLKTNKEYQLALKEMATAKKEITDRDTQLVDILNKLVDIQKLLADLREKNLPRIAELNALVGEQKNKLSQLDAMIAAEKSIRVDIAALLGTAVLEIYDRALTRGVPVLSKCEGGICAECSTRIPPQHANQVVLGKEILLCPRCKRILYAEDHLPAG